MPAFIDLTGHTFGYLTVLERDTAPLSGANKSVRWGCRCRCGNQVVVASQSLRQGVTMSCGCYAREVNRIRKLTHGRSFSPEYRCWRGMIDRCTSPNSIGFPWYGGRGITVCERWLHSFENFFADVGERPSPNHSLDRIDNDGPYSPENTRWATSREQSLNTRRNVMWTYRDETHCVSEWAEILGVKQHTLICRWYAGWSVEKILTTPVAKRTKRH